MEHRIESILASKTEGAAEIDKPKSSVDDAHLLSHEIDRKVGTMLVDVDQRLANLKEEFRQLNSTTIADNAKAVQDLSEKVQDQIGEVHGAVEDQIHGLQQ